VSTQPVIPNVRGVARTDFAQWLPLWNGYNAFYGRSGSTALAADITAATWKRFFTPSEPMHALVAETEGQLLGLVHYLFHRSTIHLEPVCYLQDLFTDARARGRGVATALIRAVCVAARAAGSQRVYWHTHESNATAQALYDKLADRSGFIVYRMQV
jgi:GNAT superfamily N-acetyltransferase